MSWQILQGDCLAVLKTLPSESVQCCVTSPPYWGLRAYGTDPQIWGGDANCEHVWHNERYYTEQTAAKCSGDAFSVAGEANAQRLKDGRWRDNCWCTKCGAWRGEYGLEPTPELYVAHTVEIFREVRRVLRADGTLWLNLGDSYSSHDPGGYRQGEFLNPDGRPPAKGQARNRAGNYRPMGCKPKDLVGIPWLVAFALRADGWYLRQDIIWAKPNPMPESVTDRCTKSHEYIFLLTKSARYFYDAEAVKEEAVADHPSGNGYKRDARLTYQNADGSARGNDEPWTEVGGTRNRRSVWNVTTSPFPEAHFATFPPKLVEPCILAGTSERGCCVECRAPWERIVEKSGGTIGQSWHNHEDDLGRGQRGGDGHNLAAQLYDTYECKTVGWKPGCDCKAETTSCTVLDPFNGAGTTGLVATRLGRNYIGIELNPQYVEMAERRIINDSPLFNTPHSVVSVGSDSKQEG